MLAIINPSVILKEHFKTIWDSASLFSIVLVFVAIPSAVSFGLIYVEVLINEKFISIALTSLSIFTGLLFSLIFIVYDLFSKIEEKLEQYKENVKLKKAHKLIYQLHINVSFTILLGFILILLLLMAGLMLDRYKDTYFLELIFSFICYYGFSIFFLSLFQILKRSYILLESELKKQ